MQDFIPDVAYHRTEEHLEGQGHVVKLEGELDMYISPSISRRLHELVEEGERHVVVDVSDARFIDTTVLEALVTAQNELHDNQGGLAVVATAPYTRRTFELTGLNDVLCVSGSRDEAVSRLN